MSVKRNHKRIKILFAMVYRMLVCSHFIFVLTSLILPLFDLTPTSALQYDEQHVHVRGFWYPINETEGVLTMHSDLKTCCVGAVAKVNQQIFVTGDVKNFSTGQPITIQGLFKFHPRYDEHGELTQLYVLQHAQLIKSTSSFHLLFTAIGITLLVFLLFVYGMNRGYYQLTIRPSQKSVF